jgi:branched-chain amino acid transport system substrate-binding protein
MAIEELNRTGGLLGRPFVLVTCDDGTDGATAIAAARHLADIGVSAVLGPFASELVIAVYSEVFRDAGIAVVSAGANSPIMASISFDGLIWSTSLPAERQAAAIAEHVLAAGYERIAIVNRDDTWGTGMREAFQGVYCASRDCFDESEYVSRVYDTGDLVTSLSDVALGLTAFDPDVTVMLTYIEDALTFLAVSVSIPTMPLRSFIWNDTLGNELVFDLLVGATGSEAALVILCQVMGTTAALPRGSVYDSWLLRYRSRWAESPVPFTANAYDAVYLLAYAYAAATATTDTPTGFAIGAAMERLSRGPDIDAGTTDWNEGILTLRAAPSATIDYVGVAGDVDFVAGTGSVTAGVEAYRLNVERRELESLGVFYSIDDVYTAPVYDGVTDGACPFGVVP